MHAKKLRRFDALIDASSAILLFKAGLLMVSCKAYELLMTPSVYEEITVHEQPGAEIFKALSGVKNGLCLLPDPTVPIGNETRSILSRLHRGEQDTIVHYINGTGRFIVIDDGKGVQECRKRNIPHVNALLFPSLLHFSGYLSKRDSQLFFERILTFGHYSAPVVQWAEQCSREDLQFFLTGP